MYIFGRLRKTMQTIDESMMSGVEKSGVEKIDPLISRQTGTLRVIDF